MYMRNILLVGMIFGWVGLAQATPLVTPHTFTAGTPALAAQVNANFQAHANAINGLAVLTPISSAPFTITSSGSYYLTGNLSSTGTGITVAADNVTIDLMGFTLSGDGSSNVGILLEGRSNVTIRNGTITGFGNSGIYESATHVTGNVVESVQLVNNAAVVGSNLALWSKNNRVNNIISKGGSVNTCIGLGESSRLSNSHISGCSSLSVVQLFNYGVAINNVITGNPSTGSMLTIALSGQALNNVISDNPNASYNIYATSNALISGNTIRNGGDGVYAGSNNVIRDNNIESMTHTGISAAEYSSILNNVVKGTGVYGITVGGYNKIVGNTITDSNQNQLVYGCGLCVYSHSEVTNNLVSRSYRVNIQVSNPFNTLRGNTSTNALEVGGVRHCYRVGADSNAMIDNTASDCGANAYGGSGWPTIVVNRNNDSF